jgi:hypothetical protein
MATTYVVLREVDGFDPAVTDVTGYIEAADAVLANNAQAACRRVADEMTDDELAGGVTLIAVPARNWTSGRNTFRAETQRKLLRS